jgi:hypothetical protein
MPSAADQSLFASSELELRLFLVGLVVVPLATAGVLIGAGLVGGFDVENALSFVVICLALVVVRGTGAEFPFLLMMLHLLVLSIYATFFLKAAMIVLPKDYAIVNPDSGVLWLASYPLCVALGVKLVSLRLRRKYSEVQVRGPQLPLLVVFPAWCISIAIGYSDPSIDDPVSIAVIHNFIPLLSALLILRTSSRVLRALVALVSFGVAALTTYRYVFALYLLVYFLVYLVRARSVPRWLMLRLAAVVAVGCMAFYGITILKYGEYQEGHLFVRTMLIEAHAAMRIKQSVDEGFAFGFKENAEMASYWWSLVPFTGKPINSGTFTFWIARTGLDPDEPIPYLPPPAPAELYLTGGYPAMVIGALIHGILLGWAWPTARRFRDSPLQVVIFVLMTSMLIGIGGGVDLFGRLEGVKWVLYVGMTFWLLASLFWRGTFVARKAVIAT